MASTSVPVQNGQGPDLSEVTAVRCLRVPTSPSVSGGIAGFPEPTLFGAVLASLCRKLVVELLLS